MKTGREDYDARVKLRTIPADEPVFLVRAQDFLWIDVLHGWCARALEAGVAVAVVEQVLQLADEGEGWPVKKPADADHLSPERRLELEVAFAVRVFSPRATSAEDLASRQYVKGYADGGAARERTLQAVIARMQQQLDEARRELAGRAPRALVEEAQGDEQAPLDFLAGAQG